MTLDRQEGRGKGYQTSPTDEELTRKTRRWKVAGGETDFFSLCSALKPQNVGQEVA
jgi:hypothetical protein